MLHSPQTDPETLDRVQKLSRIMGVPTSLGFKANGTAGSDGCWNVRNMVQHHFRNIKWIQSKSPLSSGNDQQSAWTEVWARQVQSYLWCACSSSLQQFAAEETFWTRGAQELLTAMLFLSSLLTKTKKAHVNRCELINKYLTPFLSSWHSKY